MSLRAKISKEEGTWMVQLSTAEGANFGKKAFLSWEHARVWTIWRVSPRVFTPPVDPWYAGRG